ncbi:AAA family ATPase [Bradyrhizobium sp. CCBAU 51753]|uniref:AAA family ATPase n=1 Tax=Bradyrhizobium sp. CCBAU 51753 TaxID=1325100 RepID=UPI00188CE815|nr:AAA family ATPase [Bradyrhizobium sp. CCBAU 51753]QOZ23460.1 ATP-dependent Clp protease ATP-binding subunit [Bradyrhizobium sp. CCBAU 51753]
MTGLNPWLGRLFIVLGLITIDHASPALARTLVVGAAVVAVFIFLYQGSCLPRFIMDVLDRLTNKASLEQAYAQRSGKLVTIDADQLADRIIARVIGQNDAVHSIAMQLRRRFAARRADKPIAVFCLAGAPGTGKTHFAKVLADELYGGKGHLHFFDMSQFGQPHAAASLFGQARGYVGSQTYGALTAALRDVPDSIVLLDEFEKAHPEVHKRFLTAWNDGFITEVSDGARVATSDAIFILTTNAASRRIGEIAEQNQTAEDRGRLAKASLLDAQFAPEVLSRIDEVFAFRPLKGLDIARVVALEIEAIAQQFGLRIAGGGIDPKILLDSIETLSNRLQGGVRDLTRALERQVTDKLIDARAAGAVEVRLIDRGSGVTVEVTRSNATAEPLQPQSAEVLNN